MDLLFLYQNMNRKLSIRHQDSFVRRLKYYTTHRTYVAVAKYCDRASAEGYAVIYAHSVVPLSSNRVHMN